MAASARAGSIRIRLFGTLKIEREGRKLPPFPTRHAKLLFCYLALHPGRMHPRDRLMALSWRDRAPSSARKAFRTALWRVRTVLGESSAATPDLIRVEGDEVGLAGRPDLWLDVMEFEGLLDEVDAGEEGLSPSDLRTLHRAVKVYRGDLLEGLYEEWALREQERLRLRLVHALERVMSHHIGQGELARALEAGQRLLAADPLQESVHRDLMRLHYRMGNRPAALRQYESCVRILEREFDVGPMEATLSLGAAIRAGRSPLPVPGGRRPGPAPPDPGAEDETAARERVEAAAIEFERAVRALCRESDHGEPGASPGS